MTPTKDDPLVPSWLEPAQRTVSTWPNEGECRRQGHSCCIIARQAIGLVPVTVKEQDRVEELTKLKNKLELQLAAKKRVIKVLEEQRAKTFADFLISQTEGKR